MHSRDNNNSQPFKGGPTTFCGLYVGQHVVCLHDYDPSHPQVRKIVALGGTANLPRKNVVYTVRGIEPRRRTGGFRLWLQEIVNAPITTPYRRYEPGFPAKHFRPLQKLKLEDFMPIVEHLTDEVVA